MARCLPAAEFFNNLAQLGLTPRSFGGMAGLLFDGETEVLGVVEWPKRKQ